MSPSSAPRRYRLISADSHVNEPPDLWVKRVPEALRDRAPRIERFDDGVFVGGAAHSSDAIPCFS